MSDIVSCRWFPACGGCSEIGTSFSTQRDSHLAVIAGLLARAGVPHPRIGFHRPSPWGARTRLDFVLSAGRLGLHGSDRQGVIDLPDCAQLDPALQEWLEVFRDHLPPVELGSIRLRVAPDGRRGLWLDFSNIDIKGLFETRAWLESWPRDVLIEMGQKRKAVERTPSGPKFRDPIFHPWITSRWRDRSVPLYGVVGGFSQPSLQANEWITAWFQDRVTEIRPLEIVEFGSGNGNLSFPALSGDANLTACENEPLSLAGFQMTLEHLASLGDDLRSRVRFESGDFQRRASGALRTADLLIANPPRSGLKAFLDPLAAAKNLKNILYMSCHVDSFVADAVKIHQAGFQIEELTLLDQFSQTKHVEVLSRWSLTSRTRS